jgi:hypothetical protein
MDHFHGGGLGGWVRKDGSGIAFKDGSRNWLVAHGNLFEPVLV